MIRLGLGWTAVLILSMATGCRMCADTYDYAGPTVAAGEYGGQRDMSAPRSGSILSGTIQTAPTEAEYSEVSADGEQPSQQGPVLTQSPVWENDVVDSVLISVDDRAADEVKSPVAESTQPVPAPVPDGVSDGWTAVRPAHNRRLR